MKKLRFGKSKFSGKGFYIALAISLVAVGTATTAVSYTHLSQLAIAPMQDILELNNDAKMNTPSTLGWNWKWRMDHHAITSELIHRLRRITEIYQRAAY